MLNSGAEDGVRVRRDSGGKAGNGSRGLLSFFQCLVGELALILPRFVLHLV